MRCRSQHLLSASRFSIYIVNQHNPRAVILSILKVYQTTIQYTIDSLFLRYPVIIMLLQCLLLWFCWKQNKNQLESNCCCNVKNPPKLTNILIVKCCDDLKKKINLIFFLFKRKCKTNLIFLNDPRVKNN